MGIFGAKPGEHDAPLVGLAVPIGIFEMEQLCALAHISSAISRFNSRRDQQPIGKDRGFIGFAFACRVFEDQDLIIRNLTRGYLRINGGTGHPQPPLGIEVDLNRLSEERVFCPQGNLEARFGLQFRKR